MQLLSPSRFTVLASLVVAQLAGPVEAADAPSPRWVSPYDPALHVKPPTMVRSDGSGGGALLVPDDFAERAAAFHRQNPGYWPAQAGMGQVGDVVIVEGSEEVLSTDGARVGVRMAAVTRKVIERYGDNFSAMTLWLTFDESASSGAAAYEFTVKADVRGLGITPRDNSRAYGSMGTLRSLLNMKRIWQGVREDTLEAWRPQLEVWGQESGHRWMVFMGVRDPRTGETTDALLGRDCTHYSRYVDSQASVHDGLTWTDNKDGTFTAGSERTFRFGHLDLYGMGLLPPDEMPGFFFIDEIPGYRRGTCGQYDSTPKPLQNNITGKRVDVTVDDIVAANGPRQPSFDELLAGGRQDYFREAQVVITRVGEPAQSALATQVAQRIDRARLLWEQWMRTATRNRMVVCTQLEKDCGDPRSDVTGLRFNAAARSPSWGPIKVEVDVGNPGQRDATGVTLALETSVEGKTTSASQPMGSLAVGASRSTSFDVDLRAHPCGAEIAVKATTQSDFHYHRQIQRLVLGAEPVLQDGFETDTGWRVNPDGNDTSAHAVWERGTPERTEIVAGNAIQQEGAHDGKNAWVTGAAARGATDTSDPFVRAGRTTLESPVFEASAWREPRVRYWTAFAGMKAAASGTGVVPSRDSRLIVQARAMGGAEWVEIDRLENQITVGWVLRSVALPSAIAGHPLQLRFIAEDANPGNGGVEAAIDDVHITSNLPACYQAPPPESDQGCSCDLGRRAPTSAFPVGLALLLAYLLRRRPRR
jgi:hypothetical protein